MFILIVLVIMVGIIGAAVVVGLREEKLKAERAGPQGRRNRERVNMAKAAGAFPNRKEN